ncbi:optineurin isoform X2 [Cephus cinctus]|uniref:Optineurin isoform X2 n=1 Tax=Cephus cinctus TaxID=211228 RepID=A0AAJ7BLW6_CEPCN|nr:optineurin isoform X2 [Cephus cinctus]
MHSSQAGSSSSTGPLNSLLKANFRSGFSSESHLQSLGFTMDNGKPRFRLDEPVSGALNTLHKPSSTSIDTNETDSFVVLGKSSLDSIQAASMASYAQIQQKSVSADYESMISALSPEEIQHKLCDLLEENAKLKETLTQNNLAMKQQFNTLATWQEEVMKVHQSHKEKFAETRELINQLRKENTDLKNRLSVNHELCQELTESTGKTREDLEEELSIATKELNECKNNPGQIIQAYQRLMDKSSSSIQEAKTEDCDLEDYSLLPRPVSVEHKLSEKYQRKNEEVKYLRELIASLEEQLRVSISKAFAPIQIKAACQPEQKPCEEREQFLRNLKQYDEKLRAVTSYFAHQSSRYTSIQDCLKESIDILQTFESMNAPVTCTTSGERSLNSGDAESLIKRLEECRERLIDEQVKTISERQDLIKAQGQIQKVFSDYNSVLSELEIMYAENAKLDALRIQKEKSVLEIEKRIEEDKNTLELEKNSLEVEKFSLLESINTMKKDRLSLENERKNLQAETEALRLERTALDQQNALYESERMSLLTEKKTLQKANENIQAKCEDLQEIICTKDEIVDALSERIKSLTEIVEDVPLLRAQLEIYQNDFKEEREARQKLGNEKDTLLENLQSAQKLNEELRKHIVELQRRNGGQASSSPGQQQFQRADGEDGEYVTLPLLCPNCNSHFEDMGQLQTHVEVCWHLN